GDIAQGAPGPRTVPVAERRRAGGLAAEDSSQHADRRRPPVRHGSPRPEPGTLAGSRPGTILIAVGGLAGGSAVVPRRAGHAPRAVARPGRRPRSPAR